MKSAPLLSFVLFFAVLMAACAPDLSTPVLPTVAPPASPGPTIEPTATVAPTAAPLSFTPAVYRADAEGFELDYPSGWTALPITAVGSRGSQGSLLSPGTTANMLPEGGTRVNITVYQWDPKSDLPAYSSHRASAWNASGFTIRQGPAGPLADGRQYQSFFVETPDKHHVFFLFTTLGEKYLEVSGEGDLALVEEIARTVRPLGFKP